MRYCQLVMGPAGSGKSTYCGAMQRHAAVLRRRLHVVQLDPAAEHLAYDEPPAVDVRQLIHLDDAMQDEQLRLGPNGGLVFCMEYLLDNIDWLEEQLCEGGEDDYFLIDCPGQIELYSHLDVMKRLVDFLKSLNFRVCGVFLVDACFLVDRAKFVSATMAALSVMVRLDTAHVNVITKTDLLDTESRRHIDKFREVNMSELLDDGPQSYPMSQGDWHTRHRRLTAAIGSVVEQYGLVHFHMLNIQSEDSLNELTAVLDNCLQYGEDSDVRTADAQEQDDDETPGNVQQLLADLMTK